MCNQTEMYMEMYDYDRRADRGEVCRRGIAHDPTTCLKCKTERKLSLATKKTTKKSTRKNLRSQKTGRYPKAS